MITSMFIGNIPHPHGGMARRPENGMGMTGGGLIPDFLMNGMDMTVGGHNPGYVMDGMDMITHGMPIGTELVAIMHHMVLAMKIQKFIAIMMQHQLSPTPRHRLKIFHLVAKDVRNVLEKGDGSRLITL